MDTRPPSSAASLRPAWRSALTLVVLVALGGLIYLLSPILTPFLLAAALAYLCDPLVTRLERKGLGRTWGTSLVMLGLLLALVLLAAILTPLIHAEVRLLMIQVPLAIRWADETLLPWIGTTFGVSMAQGQEAALTWAKAHAGELGQLTQYLPRIAGSGLALLGILANLLLLPVVLFYLLRDWRKTLAHLSDWTPQRFRPRVEGIASEVDVVLSQFVRGQLMVIVVMSLFYSLALWIAGLDYALAVGLIAGILVFIPYLGVALGVLLGSLAAWTQFGALAGLMPVWIAFGVGHLLESILITPWLVGEKVGLHPVAVIFALMAFGQLFGFIGILIAIPAAAATLVGLRHLKRELD
ncbi:MAG: AI-2E family transporter [Betaproteobacteria bacterium]|nr:AI-2E family transporter [Betaproteobacteria bacterium]